MIIVRYPLVPSGPNLKFSCQSDRLGRVFSGTLTCQNYHSYWTLGFWHWLFHPRIRIEKPYINFKGIFWFLDPIYEELASCLKNYSDQLWGKIEQIRGWRLSICKQFEITRKVHYNKKFPNISQKISNRFF